MQHRWLTGSALAVMALILLWRVYTQHVFAHTKEKLPHMHPVTTGDLDTLPIFLFTTPGPYNKCVQEIIRLHPKATPTVVDVDTAGDFVKRHCPDVHQTYLDLVPIAYKADLFRYCALYTHGGVYIDDDVWLHMPITTFNNVPGTLILMQDGARQTAWRRTDDTYGVWNGFLVARRSAEYAFACAMQLSIGRVATKMAHVKARHPKLAMTGPNLLGECIRPGSDATYVGFFQGTEVTTRAYLWNNDILFTHKTIERHDFPHIAHYGKHKI